MSCLCLAVMFVCVVAYWPFPPWYVPGWFYSTGLGFKTKPNLLVCGKDRMYWLLSLGMKNVVLQIGEPGHRLVIGA